MRSCTPYDRRELAQTLSSLASAYRALTNDDADPEKDWEKEREKLDETYLDRDVS